MLTRGVPECRPGSCRVKTLQPESFTSVLRHPARVCFSNRPFGVKRFQTIHLCSVDVARGLALLFGTGNKAVPSWDPRTRWSNLSRTLGVRRAAGPSRLTNSPHPSSREGHHSLARWSSNFLLSGLLLRVHAAAASRPHRNSVPSTQMRCRITASRRGDAARVVAVRLVDLRLQHRLHV